MVIGNLSSRIFKCPCVTSKLFLRRAFSNSGIFREMNLNLGGKDETQIKLLNEECILVNDHDINIGSSSKKNCHLLENINKGMLHRAFSVFLFNSKNELLLQQRSSEKITYPDHWSNTCCSHPLNTAPELDETDAIGVKRAAQRKLKHELGIEPGEVPLQDFNYLTRIQYKSENVPMDGIWGEHEIDYILVIQKDVSINVNSNEVKAIKYVNKKGLQELMESNNRTLITPWFKLVVKNYLDGWWNNLHNLTSCKDHSNIQRH